MAQTKTNKMPKKYVVIKSSEVTQGMRNLSNVTVDCTVMTVLGGDVEDMEDLLAAVNDENWTSSDNRTISAGDTTDSLVLPEKAIT